jgi:hypothetical protein
MTTSIEPMQNARCRALQLRSILNFGNVRVVGMSIDELEKAFKIRIDPETKIPT